jgi:predicted transcriptional regulator YheO
MEGVIYNSKRIMCQKLTAQAHALFKQGKAVHEVMDTLGVSQRTAYRYLKEMS